jgi:DNA-binding NtrC family response regulator
LYIIEPGRKPVESLVGEVILNILLAEDDKNFGIVIKNELEEERYNVDIVNNGVDAVLSFVDKPYDFVLIDIKMPKLDGISALRIIKKLNPEMPAIVFSGNAGYNEMEESLKLGAIRFFTKPFEVDKLTDYIKKQFKR